MPELLATKYEIEATYELLKRPEATPDAIQAVHRRWVRAELRALAGIFFSRIRLTSPSAIAGRSRALARSARRRSGSKGSSCTPFSSPAPVLLAQMPRDGALAWRSWAWLTSNR